MFGGNSAFQALYRFFHPTTQALGTASAALASDPWIRAVDATTKIVTNTANTFRVQFYALDGIGQPSTSQVRIATGISDGTIGLRVNTAVVNGAGGTIVSKYGFAAALNNASNLGVELYVTPNATTGLVDVTITYNAGSAVTTCIIDHRHIHLAVLGSTA